MLAVLRRDQPGLAAVYLPGAPPAGPEVLGHLPGLGYALLPADVAGARWARRLRHPTLGDAEVWAHDDVAPLADHIADARSLTPGEGSLAEGPSSGLLLRVPARRGEVLRDRKVLLRIAAAILGDEGLMAVDLGSRVPWSRDALAEELAHDAELDLDALYAVHAASMGPAGDEDDAGPVWLHTHGLEDLGAVDIEIAMAHPAFVTAAADPIRAIAAILLERTAADADGSGDGGPLQDEEVRFGDPGGTARLVPLTTFLRTAPTALRTSRRSMGSGHAGRRVVLCEPTTRRRLPLPGARGRAEVPRPLQLARRPPPDRFVVYIPSPATALMAERARGTLRVLQARMAEFESLRPTALVKLGYPTRDGGQEHLWFEAHGFTDTMVEASLQNQPIDVDLRAGVRAERPLDLLTDWALVTPAGWITPRSSLATRLLRERAAAEGSRPEGVGSAAG